MAATVIYRGPLERSRLSYLTESIARSYDSVKLIWLYPQAITRSKVEHFQNFIAINPWIKDWEIIDGSIYNVPSSLSKLRQRIKETKAPIIAVGYTAIFYVGPIAKNDYIWCVNGIPEEDMLHSNSVHRRVYAKWQWNMAKAMPNPRVIVTVSEPMSKLMSYYWKKAHFFAAPNCVDLQTFSPKESISKQYMTYLGTGAPWQDLDLLSSIWAALYRLDPKLRFRVISRDERTKILAQELPKGVIEFVGVEQPDEVASLLWEAEAGFLIRRSNQINQVSFPTKLGEYLAANAYIVASDLDWDPGSIVKQTGCGFTVKPTVSPEQVAKAVIEFRQHTDKGEIAKKCQIAAFLLDRHTWIERLSAQLSQLTKS